MASSPHAFVTLLTSDSYLPGVLTLAAALKDIHPSPPAPPEVDFQTVCLVTPETVDIASIKLLRKAFDLVVGVEIIEEDNERGLQLLGRPDLSTVLTKLHIFRLTQFSKIIFLDADVLPIRPLSHLFTLPHDFSAVPDVGWPDIFNSGFMVLSPGEDKFTELMTLSKSKGSWDGADQGLLNEWRGSNWNRLSFTYNTTPTAVYTYAPAYERFGSQISAIHFIGANKPWLSIPWRAPGSTTAQRGASEPLQVYDYGSLVDRWYAVYDKHYRSQPVIPQTAYASTRYEAVWDQGSHVTTADALGVPTTSILSLEDLRRIAIEGFSGVSSVSRASAPTTNEGSYISLPLEGRLDLMRPRPGPGMGGESGTSADGQRAPDASARGQLTSDDTAGSATPKVRPHLFYAADVPHGRLTSDSTPFEVPSGPHFHPDLNAMISSASGLPRQWEHPAASARWQIQPGPTSSLPQDPARSYYSAGPSHPPQSYNAWMPSGSEPGDSQLSSGRQVRDIQGKYVGLQHTTQIDGGAGGPILLSERIEGAQPVGTYPQGAEVYPHAQHQLSLPFEREQVSALAEQIQESLSQRGLQESVYQITQRLLQAYQAQEQNAPETHVRGEVRASGFDAQQVHPEQSVFLRRDPEKTDEHGHQQAPPVQEPPRPVSPPLVTWNPAVEPPPNTAPVSNFPTTTYYPNVWDQSPTHYRSDSSRVASPRVASPTEGTAPAPFTMPPPSRIPERLLHEKHYVNVLGEGQQGETPSPDRAKIKPVFPWEDKPRLTPGRVFPSTDSPPPGQFLLPPVQTASPSPSPPQRFSPTQQHTSSPPSGFPPSFSYSNVWDSVPSIQKYASRLVRPSQHVPPLGPAFDYGESRRRESALFRDWRESGESSVDGDDEDTGDEGRLSPPSKQRPRSGSSSGKSKRKEYRSQGVQTIPRETRDQSVQVTVLTDPKDADRSIKGKDQMSPRSREGSLSGISPALAMKQQDFPPSRSSIPRLPGPVTGFTGDLPKLSPLGSPTGLRSPRFASPGGSSTNLAESTPRPVLYKPTQRSSTPQRGGELHRLPPSSISRTFSSDTASSPSSAGPPISPTDTRPIHRAGGRVWDPARQVEIFKKGSEEVLSRFLKLGSWEEEKQSPSQSPA